MKDKLEDFWFNICYPFRKIRWWTRDVYYQIYYGFERMFKGYDSTETFDLDYTFIERYHKILTVFRNNHWGHPFGVLEEEWDGIIDDMIHHLYMMDKSNVEKELCKGMPEDFEPNLKTVYEIMERHKDEFFKLFAKYFYNLWD